MSRLLRAGFGLGLLALGLFCWLRASEAARPLERAPELLRAPLTGGRPLTGESLALLEETESPYALVAERRTAVEAPLFRRNGEVTLLEVEGDPSLLFPIHPLTDGAYPVGGEGCVVDRDTARTLWGGEAPLGAEITAEGRSYTVSGVVDANLPLLVVRRMERAGFSPSLALYRPDGDGVFPRQQLERFLAGVGLTPKRVSGLGGWGGIARIASLLPPWGLCMAAAWHCLRTLFPRSLPLRLTCWAGAGYLLGRGLRVPSLLTPDMLPTRWSDFSFWRLHLEQAAGQAALLWELPGSLTEYLLLTGGLLPPLVWSGASLVSWLLAVRLLRAAGSPFHGLS